MSSLGFETLRVGDGLSLRYRRRPLVVGSGITLLTVVLGLVAVGTGDFPIPLGELFGALGSPARSSSRSRVTRSARRTSSASSRARRSAR